MTAGRWRASASATASEEAKDQGIAERCGVVREINKTDWQNNLILSSTRLIKMLPTSVSMTISKIGIFSRIYPQPYRGPL